MNLNFLKANLKTVKADIVATFLFEDKKLYNEQVQQLTKLLKQRVSEAIGANNFKGKEGETALLPTDKRLSSPRLLLVGLGEQKKLNLERLRRAAATAAKTTQNLKLSTLATDIPDLDFVKDQMKGSLEDVSQAMAEGAFLSVYKFDKYFTEKKDEQKRLKDIIFFESKNAPAKEIKKGIDIAQIVCESVYLARDLENAPANEIYPETLAEAAKRAGKRYRFRAKVFDEKQIAKLNMGGVLAVCQGSAKRPRFIVLEYGANQKRRGTVVLVGKGVTFDTGGISIKPAANMSEMKMDMSGAAAVIGTLQAAARLKLPVHLVGLIPAVENMPSGTAVKPGDVIRHYNGKTSEVDNTDAEGRLILADALGYAAKYKPNAVIDLATLTGACVVALGHYATGMMGNDEKLMDELKKAGNKTYERVWPLPLYDEYEKQIKSDVADVKNVGGRWAGAITAAWFLKKFIGDYQWVHLDIAGTAILEESQDYTPKGGSGVGIRLLVEFLRGWKK